MARALRRHCCAVFLNCFICLAASGADALQYENNKDLERRLRDLARDHRDLIRIETLARTPARNDVLLVEIGKGEDRKKRPAMLVIAGAEGNDLAGTAILSVWMRSLAQSYSTNKEILDERTIYVLPRLNPDAAEALFQKPRYESVVSPLPKVDDDHDGLLDEDGPEDLNGDGFITSMRVEDPAGEYILEPSDSRLLIRADRAKGEKGKWRLFTEGRDNDKDEAWNEDGPGGVSYNRNFPYNYRFFASGAGVHQMSETVTRALADFVVEHPKIAIVFTFGAADNLSQPPKAEAPKTPPTALHEGDLPIYRELGKQWREAMGLKKELGGSSESGTFSDWMYFHRGRLSLAARPWFPALQLELAKGKSKEDKDEKEKEKTEDTEKKDEKPKKPEPDSRSEDERKYLKWIEDNAPELFIDWKEIEHPDFPGKKVEVGGFAPLAKSNPPEKLLADLAQKQGVFLTALAGKFPRLAFRKMEARHLGESVFELTLEIENTGYLATSLAQGELTREVYPTRAILNVEEKDILSGARITNLGPIAGSGGVRELRYIVHARDRNEVELEVVSMLGGSLRQAIALKK